MRGIETLMAEPKVKAYPTCSACGTPYVLRRCFLVQETPAAKWLWQRDCEHKTAAPKIVEERAK